MANPEALLVLTGEDAADRATLARLVAFQRDTPTAGLPQPTPEAWLAPLEACRARYLGVAADAKAWRRAADALVADALAQPAVALLPDGASAGPLLLDLATLLRARPLDEAVEIDLAVRWWQAARDAGLPVDADFGACWRALEWLALGQALAALGRRPAAPALVEQASRVALRYGLFKPLLPLLTPLVGAGPTAGYTF